MKKFHSVALVVPLFLVACSGGGGPEIKGNQCQLGFDPTPMQLPAKLEKNKITWDKALSVLPPGDYVEVEGSLYYVDDLYAPDRNFRIQISDVKQKDGAFKPEYGYGCARNSRKDLLDVGFSVEGVTRMQIDNNKTAALTETRDFAFRINGLGKLEFPEKKAVQKPGLDPGSVFQAAKAEESFIYKRSETDFELRSKGPVDTGGLRGTWWVSVVLRRKPVAVCPATYTPVAMNIPQNDPKKVPWAELGSTLPPGVYEEVSTNLYYDENEKDPRALRLHLVNANSEKGQTSLTTCVRNARAGLAETSVLTDSIVRVTVGEDKTVAVDVEKHRFGFKPGPKSDPVGGMSFSFRKSAEPIGPNERSGELKNFVAYKVGEKEFEVRAAGELQNPGPTGGRYYLGTLLRRKD